MAIRILTDSSSDITLAELEQYHIGLIPMDVICADKTVTDDKTFPATEFFERMLKGETIKTSQATPNRFLPFFEEAKAAGDEVVCVLLASGLSGTCQSAQIAKNMVGYDKIYIVDSRWASAGIKLTALEGCRLRDEGKLSGAEIAQQLDIFKNRIRLYACIDSMEYLVRGGRLSPALGHLGGLLNLKPYFSFNEEGKVIIVKKPRGMKKAMEEMAAETKESPMDPAYTPVPLFAYDDTNCRNFLEQLRPLHPGIDLGEPQEIGPVIGAYIGPGGFAIAYVSANE